MSYSMHPALAVVPKDKFLVLADASDAMREAMDSVASTGEVFTASDLTRVKTPSGGGTRYEIPDGLGGIESAESIQGVLVFAQRHGVLWPSDEPSENAMPVLRTYDLAIAEQVGPIPDHMIDGLEKCRIDDRHFNWSDKPIMEGNKVKYGANPYNQWGTGKDGQGKRCKEQRILFVLRPGDVYPLVVTIQPGSLNVFRKFFLNLPKVGVPYHRCVIDLSLKTERSRGGKLYAQVTPKLVGTLDAECGAVIKQKFTDVLDRGGVARQVADTEETREPGDEDE